MSSILRNTELRNTLMKDANSLANAVKVLDDESDLALETIMEFGGLLYGLDTSINYILYQLVGFARLNAICKDFTLLDESFRQVIWERTINDMVDSINEGSIGVSDMATINNIYR